MGDDAQKHQPFTIEENIEQLNSIDKRIAELMKHTSTALNSLTTPELDDAPQDGEPKASLDAVAQKEAFKHATDSFVTTLHSVDVHMKRQIMALEEAGIVNLTAQQAGGPKAGAKAEPSLRPNGVGAVGNLDVGWLNSRSTRVERDMEAELWGEAKAMLEKRSGDA